MRGWYKTIVHLHKDPNGWYPKIDRVTRAPAHHTTMQNAHHQIPLDQCTAMYGHEAWRPKTREHEAYCAAGPSAHLAPLAEALCPPSHWTTGHCRGFTWDTRLGRAVETDPAEPPMHVLETHANPYDQIAADASRLAEPSTPLSWKRQWMSTSFGFMRKSLTAIFALAWHYGLWVAGILKRGIDFALQIAQSMAGYLATKLEDYYRKLKPNTQEPDKPKSECRCECCCCDCPNPGTLADALKTGVQETTRTGGKALETSVSAKAIEALLIHDHAVTTVGMAAETVAKHLLSAPPYDVRHPVNAQACKAGRAWLNATSPVPARADPVRYIIANMTHPQNVQGSIDVVGDLAATCVANFTAAFGHIPGSTVGAELLQSMSYDNEARKFAKIFTNVTIDGSAQAFQNAYEKVAYGVVEAYQWSAMVYSTYIHPHFVDTAVGTSHLLAYMAEYGGYALYKGGKYAVEQGLHFGKQVGGLAANAALEKGVELGGNVADACSNIPRWISEAVCNARAAAEPWFKHRKNELMFVVYAGLRSVVSECQWAMCVHVEDLVMNIIEQEQIVPHAKLDAVFFENTLHAQNGLELSGRPIVVGALPADYEDIAKRLGERGLKEHRDYMKRNQTTPWIHCLGYAQCPIYDNSGGGGGGGGGGGDAASYKDYLPYLGAMSGVIVSAAVAFAELASKAVL